MLPEIIMQAGEILEGLAIGALQAQRIPANKENKALIDELIAASDADAYSSFVWTVMGVVGTETAYFVIRAKSFTQQMVEAGKASELPSSDNVIQVDFKSKRRAA